MLKQIVCGAVLLSTASFVNAGLVKQEFTLPLETTNLQKTITYDLFDDKQGTRTLESVEISMTAKTSGISFVENQDQGPATIVANLSAEISLLDSIGNVIVSTEPSRAKTQVLAGFDGILDFDGLSGTQFFDFNASESASATFIDPSMLLGYIANSVTTSTIDFKAVALSFITGNGNMTSGFNTFAGGDFSIVYNYSEIPVNVSAPAQLALFTMGLLAVVGLKKRIR